MQRLRILVIGGGAAGMMAALQAARAGADVTLLEKNEKLGKKIYITGKGRCNVTNACSREIFFEHIGTNARFLYSAFDAFSNQEMMELLEEAGCRLKTERGNRVFPQSDKSSDIIRALQKLLEKHHVQVRLHTEVRSLWLEPCPEVSPEESDIGKKKKQRAEWICRGVILADGSRLKGDRVIAATGGLSYPSTGSTGDGYRLALEAGHRILPTVPALVPLEAVIGGHISCERLQGLALKNISIQVLQGKKILAEDFGELLFTHFGVSGPVILSASSRITGKLHGEGEPLDLRINLKPALSEEQLDARLQRELTAGANKQIKNIAGSLYPSTMIPVILELAGIPQELCGREVTREMRRRLLEATRAFPVAILRTRGFGEAVITQGGISVKEIDPKTMESKRAKQLYFAGEVLDLDASTGGYNLQIAWSTGAAAGNAAARKEAAER